MQVLGYQRTLQATDLWKVGPDQEAGYLSEKLDAAWERRVIAAEEWNAGLDDARIDPPVFTRFMWSVKALAGGFHYSARRAALEKRWREVDGRKEASLAWAMNDVLGHLFWIGGAFKASFCSYSLSKIQTGSLAGSRRYRAAHGPDFGQGVQGIFLTCHWL